MSLHIEEKVEKRVITYVPPSFTFLGKKDVPPSDFNADEKTEWERQKREYHQPKVRKSDLIAKKNETERIETERIRDLQKKENDLREKKVIEEKVENFKKQCPDGNSFEYRRVLELGEKVENFKKLYPEGKERNDYITKLQKDYLYLLSQEKDIRNQYAIIEGTGVKNFSGIRVVVSIYSAGGRTYDYRNDPMLKKYEKKRDELLEPIQTKIDEQAKIMNDINSIYVNMGYCNSKVPFFRNY